jgi:hypothetical protein
VEPKEQAIGRAHRKHDHHPRSTPTARGERWDLAELALIKGLEPLGFRDAFRELHGPERRELSWAWPRWGGGYRLDHGGRHRAGATTASMAAINRRSAASLS